MGKAKHILVLGGGYGGVEAAKKLAKHYKKREDIVITVVDKHPYHTLMTELHEVAGHRVEPDSVRVPFAKIFGASKVNVVVDTITGIDFRAKIAKSSVEVYPYDYLVIGAGAEPDFFGIPGVKDNCFTLWSFEDAMKIRHHIEETFERAVAEQDKDKRRRMLTFVVAGAGFTGVEMAGELLEWRDAMCAKWLVKKTEVKVVVLEALPTILSILEESLSTKVDSYLRKKGVDLLTNTPIVGVEPGLVKLKDETSIETETLIWTCGVQGCHFAEALDLAKGKSGKKGRVLVNDEMRSVDHEDVYLVGDNIWFLENGKPLPQIVETALQTADTAAHNIAAAIDGRETKKFKSNFHGFMVSVGGKYAVSNAGGMMLSGFFAMAMKHLINLHYLFGIAGFNQCWEYLKHEFLNMDSGRSILRGFGAYKTRGYWLLPLRLWLGLVWVMEGVNKIGQGWLAWGTGSKTGWMFSSGVVQGGLAEGPEAAADAVAAATPAAVAGATPAATDAVAAATPAAAEAVSAATPAADAAAAATPAAADAVADTAATAFEKVWDLSTPIFDFNGPISTWFRVTFMDTMVAPLPFQFFQLMIIVVEIALGLALIGGLFTWKAAAVSIAMCFVFILSGMFAWDQLWFIFAAVLMLGGAGRAFGLDCWVMPFCKKWWNGTRFARKNHWYLDGPSK